MAYSIECRFSDEFQTMYSIELSSLKFVDSIRNKIAK